VVSQWIKTLKSLLYIKNAQPLAHGPLKPLGTKPQALKRCKRETECIGPGTLVVCWGKICVSVGPKLPEGAADYACQEEKETQRRRDAAKLKRK